MQRFADVVTECEDVFFGGFAFPFVDEVVGSDECGEAEAFDAFGDFAAGDIFGAEVKNEIGFHKNDETAAAYKKQD